MVKIFTEESNIISSLGFSTKENFDNILAGESGIKINNDKSLSLEPLPTSFINSILIDEKFQKIGKPNEFTRFEKLSILSINDTLNKTKLSIDKSKTLIILSTTKGNIELLEEDKKKSFLKKD